MELVCALLGGLLRKAGRRRTELSRLGGQHGGGGPRVGAQRMARGPSGILPWRGRSAWVVLPAVTCPRLAVWDFFFGQVFIASLHFWRGRLVEEN